MAKKNPLKIMDTTFRDAHQSSFATRMRIEDMEPIAKEMDDMGFHALEVWGGATFDVMTRFLNEDPWEKVRKFKKLMPKRFCYTTSIDIFNRSRHLQAYNPDCPIKKFFSKIRRFIGNL